MLTNTRDHTRRSSALSHIRIWERLECAPGLPYHLRVMIVTGGNGETGTPNGGIDGSPPRPDTYEADGWRAMANRHPALLWLADTTGM